MSDLFNSGLFLSDLSMHDNSRILAIQGNQRLSELEFACERVGEYVKPIEMICENENGSSRTRTHDL